MLSDVIAKVRSEATLAMGNLPIDDAVLLHSPISNWNMSVNDDLEIEVGQGGLEASDFTLNFNEQLKKKLFGNPFGQVSKQLQEMSELLITDINDYNSLVEKLRDSPFLIHCYSQEFPIHRRGFDKSHSLIIVKGSTYSKWVNSSGKKGEKRGRPRQIIVGYKRSDDVEHCTMVEKGSIILVRVDGEHHPSNSITFRDDLLALYVLNARPVLELSKKNEEEGKLEFIVDWHINGKPIAKLATSKVDHEE